VKKVTVCGVTFSVENGQVVGCRADDGEETGRATIPCAKGRLRAMLAVINYYLVDEEDVS
jgi:hypothetical protein